MNKHLNAAEAGPVTSEQLAVLKAAAAKRGITVHKSAAGGYLATRWNLCHYLDDLDQLREWLKRQGVL